LTHGLERDTLRSSDATAKRTRKSMSRRRGQNGHIEKSGRWFVVRFWQDVAGQEKRALVRVRICPVSGVGSLNASERNRKLLRARSPLLGNDRDRLTHGQLPNKTCPMPR
jgi:hypothetical protein